MMASAKADTNAGGVKEEFESDESSTLEAPEDLGAHKRMELWEWRFKEGGHRLPIFAPKIPHLYETEYPASCVLRDTYESLKLCKEIACDAKQLQVEFIYAKQQADLLQQERDLLKWHNANNHKVLHLKKNELNHVKQQVADVDRRLEEIQKSTHRIVNEQNFLLAELAKEEAEIQELQAEKEATLVEFEEWLGRRNDFIMETTAERRIAAGERKKRSKQYNKLRLAINRDKKTHTKLDIWSRMDEFALNQYSSAKNYLNWDFEQANDVTQPQRQILQEKFEEEFENLHAEEE